MHHREEQRDHADEESVAGAGVRRLGGGWRGRGIHLKWIWKQTCNHTWNDIGNNPFKKAGEPMHPIHSVTTHRLRVFCRREGLR